MVLLDIKQTNSVLERHHCNEAKAILKETGLLDHLHEKERYLSTEK